MKILTVALGITLLFSAAAVTVYATEEKSDLSDLKLYPGGMSFGVKIFSPGLTVVGFSDVDTVDGSVSPGTFAGFCLKDVILKIGGEPIRSIDELVGMIEKGNGKTVKVTVLREGREIVLTLTPALSESERKYKTGLWVKDSTSGIGTVTFISPETRAFAGLGHGICDGETGELIPFSRGVVMDAVISGIVKGASGSPGELKGYFTGSKTGVLVKNSAAGVFGVLSALPEKIVAEPLAVACAAEVTEGDAYIYCTLDDNSIKEYRVRISDVNRTEKDLRCFSIRVTDPELLKKTGGIIQGMSGSPIIQNGKLIGAVTHVLVSDPTRGYGIFIESMLKAMPDILG